MRVYTVHEPPLARRRPAPGPEDFVFVRDGFYFWAFLLAPFWLAYRRLWLTLLAYFVIMIGLGVALSALAISGGASAMIHLLIAILMGLEASTLWRWTLRRRGYRDLGTIVAPDREAAEQRFFDAWSSESAPARQPQQPAPHFAAPATRPAPRGSDVLGLFPEPGAPR